MRRILGPLVVLAVLACGAFVIVEPSQAEESAATDSNAASTAVEVAVRDDRFADARLTVAAGTTVTWVHKGNNGHTISAFDEGWDSGLLERGQSFSYTFSEPGVYQYLCRQHLLQGMRGTITVQ